MKKQVQFICIGAQKAGTSTLHDILKQHPDLALPKYKETHFFRDDAVYNKGISHYFNFFFQESSAHIFGEIDPEYSYFPECAARIHETFGTTKLLFILRNPVDRAYSHYTMSVGRGLESLSFIEAIEKEAQRLQTHHDHIHHSYLSRGYYTKQLARFEKLFGKENLQVYLFEDLISNPQQVVEQMCHFIGLAPYDFDYALKSNEASTAKNKRLQKFLYKPNRLKRFVGKLIPSKKLKDKIMMGLAEKNKKPAQREKLTDQTKKAIYQQFFKAEIETLEKRIERNLSHWKYE